MRKYLPFPLMISTHFIDAPPHNRELPEILLEQISHFFSHYKDLELKGRKSIMDRRELIAAAGAVAVAASASQAFAQTGDEPMMKMAEEPMMHRRNTKPLRKPPRTVSRRAMIA
jgi:hypothetical protein